MSRLFPLAKKYLTPIWSRLKPILLPIMNYFKKGTIQTALFLAFTIVLFIWFVVWGLTPILLSNFRPPISLTGDNLAKLNPNQWQRYTIETDGAVPIGIRSWVEQREFGVVTTYRSDDSYWGVYMIGDYFIYFQSDRDDLVRPPQTLTGRLGYIGDDTLKRLHELIPDMPETVLALLYSPQSTEEDISSAFSLSIISSGLLGMAWFFHHAAIKRNGGQINPAFSGQWMPIVKDLIGFVSAILRWLWATIKQLFRPSFWTAIRSSTRAYQYTQKAKSSEDEIPVITIDPSNVRIIDDD
jgi:hypothetical protein